MQKNKSPLFALIVVSAILIFSLACVTLLGTPEPQVVIPIIITETPVLEISTPENASCPVITEEIVDLNSPELIQGESNELDFGDREDIIEAYLVSYVIDDDQITDPYYESVDITLENEQKDTLKHKELWNYFSSLIPFEYRPHLVEFVIMTDGEQNILAAVAQTSFDSALWNLQVDVADTSDYHYLTFTLVHEFAHLLTLSPEQVPPHEGIFNNPADEEIYFRELAACQNFFPGEGCSNSDSYINQFYNEFWTDLYEEWNEINLEEDEDLYYEKLDDFYYKYEDQFLTDYAVTHPAEDIAESFSFFIFAEQPTGDSIAEEKILFFYDYPELVELRTEILNNLCITFPQ
jgi:hypothetical protein